MTKERSIFLYFLRSKHKNILYSTKN